jgi:salicylate hydroxylase
VHRKALLDEVLTHPKIAHAHQQESDQHIDRRWKHDKETSSGSLTIHFQDNSTYTVDAVVGTDGIHGYVRTHVLGPSHPALKPKFGGFWDSRSLIPMEKAKELLGEE